MPSVRGGDGTDTGAYFQSQIIDGRNLYDRLLSPRLPSDHLINDSRGGIPDRGKSVPDMIEQDRYQRQ